MAKVIVGATLSLDGFMNDRNGSLAPLYPDLDELRETEMLQESIKSTGAAVMGRRTYDLAQGDFTDYEYQVPIFVLTHQPPEQVTKGQNENLTLTFVSGGIESAIEQAKAAAGGRDVSVIGGADTARQCMNAGLCDEIHIGIVPLLLGRGSRFFNDVVTEDIRLERTRVLESPSRVDLLYRVLE
jgi:dihydrofolate reductase